MRGWLVVVLAACSPATSPEAPRQGPCSAADVPTLAAAITTCSVLYVGKECRGHALTGRVLENGRSGGAFEKHWTKAGTHHVLRQSITVVPRNGIEQVDVSHWDSFTIDAQGNEVRPENETVAGCGSPPFAVTLLEPGVFELRSSEGVDRWHVDRSRCLAMLSPNPELIAHHGCH